VLRAWQGLGYYARARNLHRAAQAVVERHAGTFPERYEDVLALPGVGRYTAGAVCSIALGLDTPIVDANVIRVLCRVFGLHGDPKSPKVQERLWALAADLIPPGKARDFNQAMMELGATVCMPRGPLCMPCPVTELCRARGETDLGRVISRQRKREVSYVLARQDRSVFLVQRPMDASLMAGMWELPEGQVNSGTNGTCITLRHSITVTDYTVRVFQGEIPGNVAGNWIGENRLGKLPLTGLARKILRAAAVM